MNWASITILIFSFVNLLIVANKHGKPGSKQNIWISLLSVFIWLTLIYFSGGLR